MAKRFALDITVDIARRDLLDLWRAKMLLFFFILMPLLLMGMFGYIYPPVPKSNPNTGSIGTAFPNLPVSIVQMDNGQYANSVAAEFIQYSTAEHLFKVTESPSYQDARNQLVGGELKGIVLIPQGFSSALAGCQPATVQVTVDETNPTTASVVQSEISTIFSVIGANISAQNIRSMDGDHVDPVFVTHPISVTQTPLISGLSSASSFQFLAPGFMALTVITGSLQGVATAISREKEQGTMDGLLASPISHQSIILGKVAAQTVRGLIQGFLILALSMLLFGVRIFGSPIIMVIVMVLGTASFVGVGIIMTAVAPDQETAQMMTMLLQFPMMFISGILFPIEQLPTWLQIVGKAFPLYYAADALRKVIILNAGIMIIIPDIVILIGYTILTMTVALPLFDKAMRQ
ncbi:MAG TPA: ABC transporter permease [Methylomirabilota bacterium]|nr:ABC transporter permease [Methylomirabilota bacterium]